MASQPVAAEMPRLGWREAYRMRWKRRRLLWQSWRSRHQLRRLSNRTANISTEDILAFVVLRNEANRLPYFLEYYRRLGIGHFLVVDNGSDDGSTELLLQQQDVSLWWTESGYRASRFGVDWLTYLLMTFGHNRWCLSVDTDELLTYGGIETHDLRALTALLDRQGRAGLGAMMLDLYPNGPLNRQSYTAGQNPVEVLKWFDPGPYRAVRQIPMGNLWLQGGVRERVFFAEEPRRSPTLNKIPLIRWHRRYAYANSTHSALPPPLNALYDGPGGAQPSGVLLHTKFLPEIVQKSATEKQRRQHFHTPAEFDAYYDQLTASPDLWRENSIEFTGPEQLIDLGLMRAPDW
jgi:hypothetical protein